MICEDHVCKVPVSKVLNKDDACPVTGKECDKGLICNYINAKHGTCTDPNIDEISFYCKADNECKSNICKSNECSVTKYSEERGTNWLRFFLGMQAAYLENYVPRTTFWSSQVGVMPTIRLLEYLHLEPYADITFGSTNFSTTFFRTGARVQVYVSSMVYAGGGVGLFWYNKYMSKGKRDLSMDVGYSFPLNYFVDSLRFTYINSKGSGKDQFAFSFGIVIGFGLGKRIADER